MSLPQVMFSPQVMFIVWVKQLRREQVINQHLVQMEQALHHAIKHVHHVIQVDVAVEALIAKGSNKDVNKGIAKGFNKELNKGINKDSKKVANKVINKDIVKDILMVDAVQVTMVVVPKTMADVQLQLMMNSFYSK